MNWKHNDLQHDLADYLRESKGLICWEDMQLGPAHSARPDVYAIPRSYAKFRPMVYEIKVSASDFRSDVTSGKWQNYLKYCCGVIFAAPKGVISKDDLPGGCGLIIRHENCWRMAKAPTLQQLPDIPVDAWVKLLIDGIEREAERRQPRSRTTKGNNPYQIKSMLMKSHGEELAALIGEAMKGKQELKESIEKRRRVRAGVDEKVQEYINMAVAKHRRDHEALTKAQRELAKTLGLPEDADALALRRAVNEAACRLDKDMELARLRRQFEQLQKTINEGSKPLPGRDQ